MNGALSLGRPVLRGEGRYAIPVVLKGGDAAQALALKLRFSEEVSGVTIRRAGAAANLQPVFEVSRPSANDVSYLVAFDPQQRHPQDLPRLGIGEHFHEAEVFRPLVSPAHPRHRPHPARRLQRANVARHLV